jgi:hypothetical protein
MECMKNSYAIAKEWIDKDETLWVESKLGLDSNGMFNLIPLANMIHPSLEEVLYKTNPRITNPREILDNKTSNECHRHGMMETMLSPIDIHEESTLELEKEDYISEHGSYFINTSSNPYSHKKSLEAIGLSNIATHEIFNPLVLPIHKNFERVVVDAYVYHKYCRSRCVNLEIGTQRLVLEGKLLHQLGMQFEGFPRMSFCHKASTFRR